MTIQRKLLWVLWAMMVAAGFWYSLLPGALASKLWWAKYADHGVGFLALNFVGAAASRGRGYAASLVALAIGLLIELLQLRVPGRGCDSGDFLEDAAGIVLGWCLNRVLRRRLLTARVGARLP